MFDNIFLQRQVAVMKMKTTSQDKKVSFEKLYCIPSTSGVGCKLKEGGGGALDLSKILTSNNYKQGFSYGYVLLCHTLLHPGSDAYVGVRGLYIFGVVFD